MFLNILGSFVGTLSIFASWGVFLLNYAFSKLFNLILLGYSMSPASEMVWWVVIGIVLIVLVTIFGRNVLVFGIGITLFFLFFKKIFIMRVLLFALYKVTKVMCLKF